MRDPLTWSLPLGRLFGITVRIHILFPFVAAAVILRAALKDGAPPGVWLEALLGNDDPLTPGDLPGRLPGNQQGEGAATGLEDLQARWAALTRRWDGYLGADGGGPRRQGRRNGSLGGGLQGCISS